MARTSNDTVPSSYEELYRLFIHDSDSLCRNIIRKMMPYADDHELATLPMDVWERCVNHDVLKSFDPAKANFGGVIYFVTRSVVSNHLSEKSREPSTGLSAGSLSNGGEDAEFEPGTYDINKIVQGSNPDVARGVEAAQVIEKLIKWAEGLCENARNVRDAKLVLLIDLLAQEYTPNEAAQKLGVSPSTVLSWTQVIQRQAREFI